MEVFPALALPAIVPEIWQRRRGAKYNPRNRSSIYATGKSSLPASLTSPEEASCRRSCGLARKASLDREATEGRSRPARCCHLPRDRTGLAERPAQGHSLIGDEPTGYIATIVSPETREVLVTAAEKRGLTSIRYGKECWLYYRIERLLPTEFANRLKCVWCWPDRALAHCEAIRRLNGLPVTPRSALPVPRHHRPRCRGTARCSRAWCDPTVTSHNARRNRGKFPGERRWIYAGAGRMRLARADFWPWMPRRAPMNS